MSINGIISTFGDHSSLVPIFTKDVVNSLGMTSFSYDAGGKIEAKDRFIDEFGTMAIWIGGLPFFKWAVNKTLYKAAKLDPTVDVRLLQHKEQLEAAKKYAKIAAQKLNSQKIETSLLHAAENTKLAKGMFLGKFAAATALTLGSFFTLVKAKQNYTQKQIENEFWKKKSQDHFYYNNVAKSPAFKAFSPEIKNAENKKANSKHVSFKGVGSFLSGFMFDPVKNLFLVDAGITGERLGSSRTKSEFAEYAIKEGSLLFLLYVAGRYVQQGIEKISEKVFKKPIDLHAEFLKSETLKNGIKNGTLESEVAAFTQNISKNAKKKITPDSMKKIFEFIYDEKNADNIVVKAAKESGIIETIKTPKKGLLNKIKFTLFKSGHDTGLINPHQYIKASDMEKLAKHLKNISQSHKTSGQELGKFLKRSAQFKVGSVIANMGVTCLFLGLIVPYSMMKYREKHNGNKEFHVQSETIKQLEKNFKGRVA